MNYFSNPASRLQLRYYLLLILFSVFLAINSGIAQQWQTNNGNLFFNTGNVGIGTNSPNGGISSNQTGLHVLDDNVSYLSLESTAGSGKKYTVYSAASGSLVFWDASSSTMRGIIDANGYWGIGTADPSAKLHVENPTGINGTWLKFTEGVVDYRISNEGGRFKIREGANDRFVIRSGGNIGMGTKNPTATLEIRNPISNNIALKVGPSGNSHSYFHLDRRSGKDGGVIFTKDGVFDYQFVNLDNRDLQLYSYSKGTPVFNVQNSTGNIGIGTTSPSQKLSVAGKINAREIILENVTGADFVFEEDYDLRTLEETEQFIKANKHLPEVPSATEMAEEGLALKEMNILLLQKVEELTLHLIRQEKSMQFSNELINNLQKEVIDLKSQVLELSKD